MNGLLLNTLGPIRLIYRAASLEILFENWDRAERTLSYFFDILSSSSSIWQTIEGKNSVSPVKWYSSSNNAVTESSLWSLSSLKYSDLPLGVFSMHYRKSEWRRLARVNEEDVEKEKQLGRFRWWCNLNDDKFWVTRSSHANRSDVNCGS